MWKVFFHLAIYGGFRRGEICGLEWQDIDFDTGIISIRRTSSYTKAKGIYTDTPKTVSSRRSLKMPPHIISMLKQYRGAQAEYHLALGDQWAGTGRLMVKWDGNPMNPNTARKWLERFCKRTGMRMVNIHSFRHLNASLLITYGTDAKTVSAALGHTQVSTTLTSMPTHLQRHRPRHPRPLQTLWCLRRKAHKQLRCKCVTGGNRHSLMANSSRKQTLSKHQITISSIL